MRKEFIDVLCVPSEITITLHNPIDKALLREKANEENPYGQEMFKKYVWVGRFNKIKRVDVLVKAFSLVVKKEPLSKLFLIGKIDCCSL